MCYNGKCFHFIPVEYGSLALGVISAISTALSFLWSTVNGIIIAVDMANPRDDTSYQGPDNGLKRFFQEFVEGMILWAVEVFMVIVAVGSVIAFIYSVVLCFGVCKRRPGHVLAYFIYGSVVTVLSASLSIVQICNTSYDSPLPGIVGLIACAVYSLCLVMVYKTYVKLQQEAMFKNHLPLVESKSGPYPHK